LSASTPWRVAADGLLLQLRVTPNAGTDRLEGVEIRADGQQVLRVRVAAVADRGRANAAVIALLARQLGVPKTSIAIVAGETARLKTAKLDGDGAALAGRLAALMAANA
jgi:uncharacterized protein (TIGR00251 family)